MTEPANSTEELLVLHALRLKGFTEVETVAELTGLDGDIVVRQLTLACRQNQVGEREGARSGWVLTQQGREYGERLLAAELDDAGARPSVEKAYAQFVSLNQPMLSICTRWQVKSQDPLLLNDHDDAAYDAAIIADLAEIDDTVQQICAELTAIFDRFSRYPSGFAHALARLNAGDKDWLTKPTLLSYHTLWFELHEDLLATLGLDRASETARTAS